jgi:hypothetical protein
MPHAIGLHGIPQTGKVQNNATGNIERNREIFRHSVGGMCDESAFVCRTKGLYPTEEMHRVKRWVNQQLSRKVIAQERGCPRGSVCGM